MPDISDWNEITIKAPGWTATADQISDFLRAVFPEDAILEYQRRVTEAGLREAVDDFRKETIKKAAANPEGRETLLKTTQAILSHFDPDDDEWGGFFPSKLLCPHHETGAEIKYYAEPAMAPCKGVPWCKAGSEIRGTRR